MGSKNLAISTIIQAFIGVIFVIISLLCTSISTELILGIFITWNVSVLIQFIYFIIAYKKEIKPETITLFDLFDRKK